MEDEEEELKTCSFLYCIWCKRILSQKEVLLCILYMSSMMCYMHRLCLNMAIVNMVKNSLESLGNVTCFQSPDGSNGSVIILARIMEDINDEQYDWDEAVQSYILLSFFIGYMISNFCIGFVIHVIGCRWTLFIGILMTSVSTLMIPPIAYYTHWTCICLARIVAGIGQAAQYSTTAMFVSRWIVDEKKSSITAILLTTFGYGLIVGYLTTGFIMELTKTWCWVFYFNGLFGLILAVAYYLYVYSSPDEHPHITQKELNRLKGIPKASNTNIPLKSIFTDVSPWMFLLGYFASDLVSYIVLTNMPKYFVQVLGYTPGEVGIALVAPAACVLIGGYLFGKLGDYLIGHYLYKITYRCICTFIGIPLPAICLLIMVFCKCDYIAALILLCLSMFFKSAFFAGAGMMAVDITLNYGGLLYGYGNVAGGFSGIMAPYLIGYIAYENTFPQWEIVQYITLAISVICTVPILIFSKAERRRWDYGDNETKPPVDETTKWKKYLSCYQPT